MVSIELKRWTADDGIQYSEFIEVSEEDITAEDYIRNCEAVMEEPWWSDRISGYTDYYIAVYGDNYSGAWVSDVLGTEV